jgi:hypothetical protein
VTPIAHIKIEVSMNFASTAIEYSKISVVIRAGTAPETSSEPMHRNLCSIDYVIFKQLWRCFRITPWVYIAKKIHIALVASNIHKSLLRWMLEVFQRPLRVVFQMCEGITGITAGPY